MCVSMHVCMHADGHECMHACVCKMCKRGVGRETDTVMERQMLRHVHTLREEGEREDGREF